jgi:molybdopterin/thiamine biosynthesis adenylyltransferase
MLTDNQLLRYSRHIFLPEIDIEGQEKILQTKVLIIGAGGLGSAVSYYLAASGIGTIYISDHDKVELSNLQRQIVHRMSDIGKLKTESARDNLLALNPEINVIPVSGLSNEPREDFQEALTKVDIIIDASDNFATRYKVNALCIQYQKPLISGSSIAWQGQVAVFPLHLKDSACYACLYPKQNATEEQQAQCSATGVVSPLVGIIGSMQALEVIKFILKPENYRNGTLISYDALNNQWRNNKINKDQSCQHN